MVIDPLYEAALQHLNAGRKADADGLFGLMCTLAPREPLALHRLGYLAFQLGRQAQAIELIERAIALKPDWAEAHYNLGTMLFYTDSTRAIACFRKTLELDENYARAHADLGCALLVSGDPAQAAGAMQRAIELDPANARSHLILANALREVGQLDRAIAAARHAMTLQPDIDDARFCIAMSRLLQGDFGGWPDYEAGWARRAACRTFENHPRWEGEEMPGRTILLHSEHGFGDAIQLSRYLPAVAARGFRVKLLSPPQLCRLMSTMTCIEEIVSTASPLPAFDVHASLMSLPRIFQSTIETIPPAPYLHAPPELVQDWQAKLAKQNSGLKVGITWAAGESTSENQFRSLHLSDLAPLARISGVQFYSLQIGPASAEARTPPAGMNLVDWTADIHDFADTAALIANLGLVIACDTAVVHIAGALGKPVWVLLPYAPSCLWMLDRRDSPWYPTARLFRQQHSRQWEQPVKEAAIELERLTHQNSAASRAADTR